MDAIAWYGPQPCCTVGNSMTSTHSTSKAHLSTLPRGAVANLSQSESTAGKKAICSKGMQMQSQKCQDQTPPHATR
jgi:hypothetical protein